MKAHEQRRLERQQRIARLERHVVATGPRLELPRCHWCGEPIIRFHVGTCSNTTYHGDGTSTVVLWHTGCAAA